MVKTIVCSNCGAKFDESEPRCPFCGYFNYVGSEEEYKGKLQNLRNNLQGLSQVTSKEYKKELKGTTKKVAIAIVISIVAIAFIMIFYTVSIRSLTSDYYYDSQALKKKIIWEHENFSKLDAWFEAGEYDAIIAFENQLYEDDSDYSIYKWEHKDVINVYMDYTEFWENVEELKDDYVSEYTKQNMIGTTIYLYGEVQEKDFTQNEWTVVSGFRDEVLAYGMDILSFTEEEMQQVYESALDDGYFDMGICRDYYEQMKDRFPIEK